MTGISDKKKTMFRHHITLVIPDRIITNLNTGILELKLKLIIYHNWNIVSQLTAECDLETSDPKLQGNLIQLLF